MILALIIILAALLMIYSYRKHRYWADMGVYSPACLPLLGNILDIFIPETYYWEFIDKNYHRAKQYRFFGIYDFTSPRLFICDPELLRLIFIKDFDHFVNRRPFSTDSPKDKVFNDMLPNMKGDRWKFVRNILTPTFTSGKLKGMFPFVCSIADKAMAKSNEISIKEPVEIYTLAGRYALEVIASCAFGIEENVIEGYSSQFVKSVGSVSEVGFMSLLKTFIFFCSPKLFKLLGLSFFTKDTAVLAEQIKETIKQRQNVKNHRGDFLDLTLDAHNNISGNDAEKFNLDIDSIIAQSVLFLIAGFDTVRNTLSFIVNDLANNPDEQNILREELQNMVNEEGFTYQAIMECKQLDAFISESMRMIPTGFFTERTCTENFKIPDCNITVPKGTIITIPIWSLHHDPEYWDNPSEFRSSRFLSNKEKSIPYTYMPFGHGPRNCIGNRFALMEMKIFIAKLVLNYDISFAPRFKMTLANSVVQTLRPSKGVLIDLEKM